MNRLLLATTNKGKLTELRAILAELPMELVTPTDLGITFHVVEDGASYLENARKKAEAGRRLSGLATLADDSGLEVPLLEGRPGIDSAYFAGADHKGDGRALVAALLKALGDAATSAPSAFFRSAAVLALPDGRVFTGEGVLAGTIAAEPRGTHGFGFDPIFQLPDGRRLAELSTEEKNLLSHRARALNALEVHGAFDAALS
ncbi:MAG: non-canonical purine NTP pyrophosphatase [Candidatus Dormibacteraeota bacterium]|nr:non-canonical purine NTP pyrophosphatase [Candidatus Dormibacteraeota bacterium]